MSLTTIKSFRLGPWAAFALFAFVFATNYHLNWDEGLKLLTLDDVANSYIKLSEAAPGLPTQKFTFHHAQRLFLPYTVGVLARLFMLPIKYVYEAAMYFVLLASLLVLAANLWSTYGPKKMVLGFASFVLQPYAVRYYLLAPGMTADLLFVLGLIVTLSALVKARGGWLLIGGILAALGRQSTLAVLPGVLLYIHFAPNWSGMRKRHLYALAYGLVVIAVYEVTKLIAIKISSPNSNLEHVLGLWIALKSSSLGARSLIEHALRHFVPLVVILSILLLFPYRKYPRENWAFLLMSAGLIAQPFLAGPEITGANAGRLASLGLAPLIYAWLGAEWRIYPDGTLRMILISALMVGSFHHMYSIVGPTTPVGFVFLQFLVALLVATSLMFLRKKANTTTVKVHSLAANESRIR